MTMILGNISFNPFRQPKEVPVREVDTAETVGIQSCAVAIALAIGVVFFVRR